MEISTAGTVNSVAIDEVAAQPHATPLVGGVVVGDLGDRVADLLDRRLELLGSTFEAS
jgi:hypothetical protein